MDHLSFVEPVDRLSQRVIVTVADATEGTRPASANRLVASLGVFLPEWRDDYNRVRPHSALANRTPEEFRNHHI